MAQCGTTYHGIDKARHSMTQEVMKNALNSIKIMVGLVLDRLLMFFCLSAETRPNHKDGRQNECPTREFLLKGKDQYS